MTRFLHPNEKLTFSHGVPSAFEADVEIECYDGSPSRTVQIGKDLGPLGVEIGPGLFRASLVAGGRRFAQYFYSGNMAELWADLDRKFMRAEVDRLGIINLSVSARLAQIFRRPAALRTELDARTQRQATTEMERKAIFVAAAAHEELKRHRMGMGNSEHITGLQIRGFYSKIDDQLLHYRLFVPSSYKPESKALPLIVVMQTVGAANVPFIESVYVRNLSEAERWARLAETLNVGILWPGYRSRPYGNPTDITYLDEVLAEVSRNYSLNSGKISLYGICSAGMTASMEVVRRPRRYSALAFDNPVLHRLKNRFDDGAEYSGYEAYRVWLLETTPVQALSLVKNLPVWINHDADDPGHGPIGHSVDFLEQARAAGQKPKFTRYTFPRPLRRVVEERQLTWLAQQQREKIEPLIFGVNQSGGPLSRSFAERFIVVEATGGNEAERAANRKLSSEFQAAWLRTNYGPCRVVEDRALSADEDRRSNLVLLGNAETNVVWAKFSARLPIKIEPNRLTLGGRSYDGEGLALQAWFQHPDHAEKKVVLIGAARPEHAVFGTLELALDGWFDYSVWRHDGDRSFLVAAERFN